MDEEEGAEDDGDEVEEVVWVDTGEVEGVTEDEDELVGPVTTDDEVEDVEAD